MLLIGIALAIFFFVEWLLTTAVAFKSPVWLPPLGLVHVVYWVIILLALIGGIMEARKK